MRRSHGWRALAALLVLAGAPAAHAHLMGAQQGTLNLVGDGAYLVISLPVSALEGVDDDGDGRLSGRELQAHLPALQAQVRQRVQLLDGNGARPLEGLMLSLSPDDAAPGAPAAQLVVLGRFALADRFARHRLRVDAWGRAPAERELRVQVTRLGRAEALRLTPEVPQRDFLAPPWSAWLAAWTGMAWPSPPPWRPGPSGLAVVAAVLAGLCWLRHRRH